MRPLHVEILARNTTNWLYIIQYRYVFRDREGMELEPAMSWHRDAFRPKSTVYLKGTRRPTAGRFRRCRT